MAEDYGNPGTEGFKLFGFEIKRSKKKEKQNRDKNKTGNERQTRRERRTKKEEREREQINKSTCNNK